MLDLTLKYNRNKWKKKGTIFELFGMMVFLMAFALIVLLSYLILTSFRENTSESGVLNNSRVGDINEAADAALLTFDSIFLFIFVGLIMFTGVSAFFIKSHPAFFFGGVLGLVLAVMVAAQLSNVYDDFSNEPDIVAAAEQYTVIDFIMDRLPFLLAIAGGIILILLYTNLRGSP